MGRVNQIAGKVKQWPSRRLDRDMDQDKPVFICSAVKILHHIDIVERDWPVPVEPRPIVEHITAIGQQRCLIEAFGQRHHRTRQIGGQGSRRFAFAPNIGLDQKRIAHHRHANLFFRRIGRPFIEIERG